MAVLEKIKVFLEERRDLKVATLIDDVTEREGYFDINDIAGGNMDDAFTTGCEVGEAQFIEELLSLIEDEEKKSE